MAFSVQAGTTAFLSTPKLIPSTNATLSHHPFRSLSPLSSSSLPPNLSSSHNPSSLAVKASSASPSPSATVTDSEGIKVSLSHCLIRTHTHVYIYISLTH
ncbi:hypothetical protein CsSME_00001599 [Camellia sinensis var. sinensis]